MSRIVTIETELRNPEGITRACRRLGLEEPIQGNYYFGGTYVKGAAVDLGPIDPTWKFGVIVQDNGKVAYDNYEEAWGKTATLHKFIQTYAIEMVHLEAERQGHHVNETAQADGGVVLEVATH